MKNTKRQVMEKTKAGKAERKTLFCTCKNSCQKGTGPKRIGCPCKDKGLYCCDQCKCGTNVIVCKNQANTSDGGLVSELSRLQVADISDGDISDNPEQETTKTKQETTNYPEQNSEIRRLSQSQAHEINNGYCLVIHNRFFGRKLRPREGSQNDLKAIKVFCKETGLTIDILENVKVKDIQSHCHELTENKNVFQNYDGFVCFILSHGDSSGVRGYYNETITIQEIVSYFKECESLLGKPKLFFIQACRSEGKIADDSTEMENKKRLLPPESSDILIAHSTIPGTQSYRDIRTGSWFIQALIKQFKAHAQTLHVMDIMTIVNEDISKQESEGKRQMPIQVSTLRKFVYFKINASSV